MPLKNSQYNAIIRRYDQLRFENSRQLEARRQKVYGAVPQIRQIDEDMAHTAAEYARKAVSSKKNTSIKDFKEDMARLSQKRQALMEENGFPADYLELKYHCPDCQDTGFIGNEKCHCFKQAIVDLVYAQSNIRQRLTEENFDTFRLDLYSAETDRRLGISPRENMENILSCCRDSFPYLLYQTRHTSFLRKHKFSKPHTQKKGEQTKTEYFSAQRSLSPAAPSVSAFQPASPFSCSLSFHISLTS